MKLKPIISVVLILASLALAYTLYRCIMLPVNFETEFNHRKTTVVAKLKDLRNIEELYRLSHGEYCASLDTLIMFVDHGQVKMVKKIGIIPDSLTEAQALKSGIISRDTVFVDAYERLVEEGKISVSREQLSSLKYIPYTQNKEVFEIGARVVNRSGVFVPVFEIKADFDKFLTDLDPQMVVNKIAETKGANRYPGWKVGDLTQPITEGNWE